MRIIDFYPVKGFYKKNEDIEFKIIIEGKNFINGEINIYDLDVNVFKYILSQTKLHDDGHAIITISKHGLDCGGYIAEINIDKIGTQKIAFDILEKWEDFPRYGYVSKFTPQHENVKEQIESMVKYHVNGVQFYDWQYRHDNLLSSTTEYLDPFDRKMSLDTVNSFIDECHARNMSAMPYLAVYAASVDFWQTHKEWGMYDVKKKPLMFEDFLGIVDPTFGSKWFNHLDNECDKLLKKTKFDGLHIDQYGEPKIAYNFEGQPIDIPKAFVDFINHQSEKENGTVVFNAVGNWPIEDLAKSKADFMYIEVWDFTPTFGDLRDICLNARKKSQQKPLIIPIYIKAQDFNNILLADAVINASGGTHLEIGDGERLLSDPYFPKAEDINDKKLAKLRKYWDFVVGYQKVLGPKAINKDIEVKVDKEIMTISRKYENYEVINFINCKQKDKWIDHMDEPKKLSDTPILFKFDGIITKSLFGSPDLDDITLQHIDCKCNDGWVEVVLPSLHYWSMILIEKE